MVITFLPVPDFKQSARMLDPRRLGKQRLEVVWILDALKDPISKRHKSPQVQMWLYYTDALVAYGLAVCEVWMSLGHEDNQYPRILEHATVHFVPTQENVPMPPWLGKPSVHASHRGNLLLKDPKYYGSYGWTDSVLLPYDYPVNLRPPNVHHTQDRTDRGRA